MSYFPSANRSHKWNRQKKKTKTQGEKKKVFLRGKALLLFLAGALFLSMLLPLPGEVVCLAGTITERGERISGARRFYLRAWWYWQFCDENLPKWLFKQLTNTFSNKACSNKSPESSLAFLRSWRTLCRCSRTRQGIDASGIWRFK